MRSHAFRRPETQILQYTQRLDDISHRLNIATRHHLKYWHKIVHKHSDQLTTLNPDNVLRRGYAMALKDDEILTSARTVEVDDTILVKLTDGTLHSNVLRKEYDKKT
jgi:exodeoxyribonuclease VII large subunit